MYSYYARSWRLWVVVQATTPQQPISALLLPFQTNDKQQTTTTRIAGSVREDMNAEPKSIAASRWLWLTNTCSSSDTCVYTFIYDASIRQATLFFGTCGTGRRRCRDIRRDHHYCQNFIIDGHITSTNNIKSRSLDDRSFIVTQQQQHPSFSFIQNGFAVGPR